MTVMLMVLLDVDPKREAEFLELFKDRHAQSMRLGALSHDVWRLVEPGEEPGRWMGTITYRDMEHFAQFGAAQEADPEAQETMRRVIGPGGSTRILSQRVAVLHE